MNNSDTTTRAGTSPPSSPAERRHFKNKPRQKWRNGSKGAILRPKSQNVPAESVGISKLPRENASPTTVPREGDSARTHTTTLSRDPPQSPPNQSSAAVPKAPPPGPAPVPVDNVGAKHDKPRYHHHKWHNKPHNAHKGHPYRQRSADPPHAEKEEQERDDLPTAPKDDDPDGAGKDRSIVSTSDRGVEENAAADDEGTNAADTTPAPEKLSSRNYGHRGHRKTHWASKKYRHVGRPQPKKENADKVGTAATSGNQTLGEQTCDAVEVGNNVSTEDVGKEAAANQEISTSHARHDNARNNKKPRRKFGAKPKKHRDRPPVPADEGDDTIEASPLLVTTPKGESEGKTKEEAEGAVVTTNAAGAAILSRLASGGGRKDHQSTTPLPPPPMSYAEATVATQTSVVEALAQADLLGPDRTVEVGTDMDGQGMAPGYVGGYYMAVQPAPFPVMYDGTQGYDAAGYGQTDVAAVPPPPVPVAAVAVQPAPFPPHPMMYGDSAAQYQNVDIGGTVYFVPAYSHPGFVSTTMNADAPVFEPAPKD